MKRWGPLFVLFNGLTITGFATGALLAPEPFWDLLGVSALHVPMARVMAWYLWVLGIGGLAVWKRPEQHPWVVLLLGMEKLGPAALFPWLYLHGEGNGLLLAVGLFDGVLAGLLIGYGAVLRRRSLVVSGAPGG